MEFIVIEGTDGSGSTTQIQSLERHMKLSAWPAYVTEEPGHATPIGSVARQFLMRRLNSDMSSEAFDLMMGLLISADRIDHCYNPVNGIAKILETSHVICSRYTTSTLAYNGTGVHNEDIFSLVTNHPAYIKPTLTIFLYAPIMTTDARMNDRVRDAYENVAKQVESLRRYANAFGEQDVKDGGENLYILDATLPADHISTLIWAIVKNRIDGNWRRDLHWLYTQGVITLPDFLASVAKELHQFDSTKTEETQ